MSDDRLAQARAEAERRYGRIGVIPQDALFMFKTGAFVDGAEWADMNSKPHTITRAALRDTAMMIEHTRQDGVEAMLPGLLGIKVVDGDE